GCVVRASHVLPTRAPHRPEIKTAGSELASSEDRRSLPRIANHGHHRIPIPDALEPPVDEAFHRGEMTSDAAILLELDGDEHLLPKRGPRADARPCDGLRWLLGKAHRDLHVPYMHEHA